jgi:argininosuccinate lyase
MLGFAKISSNSMDAVSDRDFVLEFTGAAALSMLHLSRMSEDLILFSSDEFGFVDLGDQVTTGSSLLPQKKNPDALELIRGKTGRVVGNHMSLITVLKGLPLTYNKDLQEDKEPLFDSADTWICSLAIMRLVLSTMEVRSDRALQAASTGFTNATELADYLVSRGLPFREAHGLVGKIVLDAVQSGRELGDLSLGELKHYSERVESDVFQSLSVDSSLAAKNLPGGTAPNKVAEALARARESLDAL